MADKLLNIGPKSAAWLRQVGVRTFEDLQRLGAVGVFLKVKRAGFRPSLNLLYALAGAEQGCHWTALAAEHKSAMVLEVAAFDDALILAKRRVMPCRDIEVERAPPDVDAQSGVPGDCANGEPASGCDDPARSALPDAAGRDPGSGDGDRET